MTKNVLRPLVRIGVAALLIAVSVRIFLTSQGDLDQLVVQGIVFVCAFGLLAQGVVGVVTARRR